MRQKNNNFSKNGQTLNYWHLLEWLFIEADDRIISIPKHKRMNALALIILILNRFQDDFNHLVMRFGLWVNINMLQVEMLLYNLLDTWISWAFSLKIGKLSLCCRMDSSVLLPYDTWLPPKAFLFHSGRWTGIAPMPLMLAAICLPSSAHQREEKGVGDMAKF